MMLRVLFYEILLDDDFSQDWIVIWACGVYTAQMIRTYFIHYLK